MGWNEESITRTALSRAHTSARPLIPQNCYCLNRRRCRGAWFGHVYKSSVGTYRPSFGRNHYPTI